MNEGQYDYLIVGAGFFGSICASELTKAGKRVLVIDRRNHIGGNCYTDCRDNINIHFYGPHIFHTSDKEIWNWINQYAEFNNFRYSPVGSYQNKLYSLPVNMWTFYQLWGVSTEQEARSIIEKQSAHIQEPSNLEEQAIKLVGTDIYNILIKGYTEKHWKKSAAQLPKEIITRLPVRFTFDNNYYNDVYQGIPVGGYTKIFEKLLNGIEVRTNTDYFTANLPPHKKVIYTGPIDKFFNYKYGYLEYKTVELDHVKIENKTNYQSVATVNYTDIAIPYTRTIEHKHFDNAKSNATWVSWETPIQYIPEKTEPYYPVNDASNNQIYNKYKEEAKNFPNVIFGGRLGEYKYYDMHLVIKSALNSIKKELQ